MTPANSEALMWLALALCAGACDRGAAPSAERPAAPPIEARGVAPAPGQEWTYEGPPREFSPRVLVVDVRIDGRCGELALVQVLDLYEGHGAHLQRWITLSKLKESVSELRRTHSTPDDRLSPGSDGREVPADRACVHFDQTVSEMLRKRHFLRTISMSVPGPGSAARGPGA